MDSPHSPLLPDTPRDNLQRLWVMRNMALAGQVTVIAVTELLFRIALPLAAVASTVILLAAFNGFTWLRLRHPKPVGEVEIFGQFWVDLTALSTLLYFTGGATNPFISFYLPILAVAAAALAPRYVWFLSGFSLVSYIVLAFEFIPLDIRSDADAMLYHLTGMFVNFVIGAGWIAWFVLRMSSTLRERDRALGVARARLLEDARGVALGAQAARAAHELGTPLASIAVAAGELRQLLGEQSQAALALEIATIEEQVARCKLVLDSLKDGIAERSDVTVALADWFDGYLDDWKLSHPALEVDATIAISAKALASDVVVLGQVLTIALENAARVSESITIDARLQARNLEVTISDRGPGIDMALLDRLGIAPVESQYGGRGVGLFLAASALRARGGALKLLSRTSEVSSGTTVAVVWPLEVGLE